MIRQVPVTDEPRRKIKAVIKLSVSLGSIANIEVIRTILKGHGRGTIQITEIQAGSVKLIVEGSQAEIDRLRSPIESGELTELDGFLVEDARILSESSKHNLVEETLANPIKGRKLRNADLSDADLSGADLSGADLSNGNLSGADLTGVNLSRANLSDAGLTGAELSDANLSNADLSGANISDADLGGAYLYGVNLRCANFYGTKVELARFRENSGITEQLKQDLINRGAIFEDSPDD